MSVREELDNLRNSQTGVDHLVYGDASAGMVLYSASETPKGQEAHDALIKRGITATSELVAGLGSVEGDKANGIQVIVTDDNGVAVFVRAPLPSEEGLFLSLSNAADPIAVAQSAAEALSRIVAGGEE